MLLPHCNHIVLTIIAVISILSGCKKQTKLQTPTRAQELHAIKRASNTFFDNRSAHEHVSYIYAPGVFATELIMGRYCPQFIASTGEKLTWRSAGHVIGQPHTAVVFPETNLRKPGGFTLNPLTAIYNGIHADLFPLASRVMQEAYDFDIEGTENCSDSVMAYQFNFKKTNIAQKGDIKALYTAYQKHLLKHPCTNIVLYGDSRGAATIFNFIAQHKPAHVKAAVMEGIFDTIPHCVKHFLYTDKTKRSEERLYSILTFIAGSYNKKGPFPLDYAETITDDIPLLFVTSLKDGLVPPQGTLKLYKRLKERGLKNIHLVVLKKSLHPCYMIDNQEDRQLYENVVHAFYKKYNLPYNSNRAAAGAHAFAMTQPTSNEVDELYPLPKCSAC